AYAPAPVYTPEVHEAVMRDIVGPVLRGLAAEGNPYRGVLYAGLMVTSEGPKVLEFNCRFGDPEAQPVLMLLESDLVPILEAVVEGRLREAEVRWREGAAVCVVVASEGYPGPCRKGLPIEGLEEVPPDVMVFHAGTAFRDGRVVTAGGRVLGVTAYGPDIRSAVDRAYAAVGRIRFEGMHYRRDIGWRALARQGGRP
ncbi:MAG: phosphoribosylamine--glycine ligase, partial [Firmicutes bacterium]|nr:phosphoribosylamine--glycine ligase [Bacillota bacterium]